MVTSFISTHFFSSQTTFFNKLIYVIQTDITNRKVAFVAEVDLTNNFEMAVDLNKS